MGGMGNQMFQYAFGRRLSVFRGVPLKLDLGTFAHPAPGDTPRSFALGVFSIHAETATAEDIRRLRRENLHGGRRVLWRASQACRPYYRRAVVIERSLRFDPRVLRAPRDAYVVGWWASERYFTEIATLIRTELTLLAAPTGANAALAREIEACEAVAVHVRRGDYVTNPATNRAHGLCGEDYYLAAMTALQSRVPNARAFVFSDDIGWARKNLRFELPTTFVDHNSTDQAHEDMRLMTLCRHHIIANSTFSWWAAWLCRHAEKTVIAPRKWSSDARHDTRDLYPANWELY